MGSTLSISQEVAVKLITNSVVSQDVTGLGRSTSKLTHIGVGTSFSSLCGIMASPRPSDPRVLPSLFWSHTVCHFYFVLLMGSWVTSLFQRTSFWFYSFFFLFWFIFHHVLRLLFFYLLYFLVRLLVTEKIFEKAVECF